MPAAAQPPGLQPAARPALPQGRAVPSFASQVYEVARKEVLQHIRTKRLLIVGSILVAVLILITIVLPLSVDVLLEGADEVTEGGIAAENFVILLFLIGFLFLSGYFLFTLLPIVLTADAVCSEWSSRTIFLLLSKPVSRAAFVVGKFAGSAVTVAATVFVLLLLDFLVLIPIIPGNPNGEEFLRFLGALGIVILGVMAWTSVSLFFSTMTRSNVVSMILSLASWIIIFPLLGAMDRIISLIRFGSDSFGMTNAEADVGWSQYLSPGSSMQAASGVLIDSNESFSVTGAFSGGEAINPWGAVVALLVHAALFLGLSLWVVQRRNFE